MISLLALPSRATDVIPMGSVDLLAIKGPVLAVGIHSAMTCISV